LDYAFERTRKKAILAAEEAGRKELASAIAGFQFRDLRAKAGTEKADSAGILEARQQLGHGSVTTTERYVRLGTIVSPTK
jgi:integrase